MRSPESPAPNEAVMLCGRFATRVPAHFVQRDEPVVAVERRVLQSLGHRRTRKLLPPQGEFERLGVGVGLQELRTQRSDGLGASASTQCLPSGVLDVQSISPCDPG